MQCIYHRSTIFIPLQPNSTLVLARVKCIICRFSIFVPHPRQTWMRYPDVIEWQQAIQKFSLHEVSEYRIGGRRNSTVFARNAGFWLIKLAQICAHENVPTFLTAGSITYSCGLNPIRSGFHLSHIFIHYTDGHVHKRRPKDDYFIGQSDQNCTCRFRRRMPVSFLPHRYSVQIMG